LECVKWVKMKPLKRVETLLSSLLREPKTLYSLYRTTPGCAYTSLRSALKELIERGLIEVVEEERLGFIRRVYKLTDKGRRVLQALKT